MVGCPRVLGWAPGTTAGRVLWVVGTGGGPRSDGVEGVEAVPGGGQVGGPLPAGWDLEDSLSGVGDQAGWGGQDRRSAVFSAMWHLRPRLVAFVVPTT
jgi:hypothetical protein